MRAIIFIGSGKIAYGKLAQSLDHGALTIQVLGDFDDAMQRVQQVAGKLGIYLVNSINPFRLEGQKTIMYRVLEALHWQVPDWIVVPGGNLGNVSAFGKAFSELVELGLMPKLAAPGRHQRRRGQTLSISFTNGSACAGKMAGPTRASSTSIIRIWKHGRCGPARWPAPWRSIARSICTRHCGPWPEPTAWCAK